MDRLDELLKSILEKIEIGLSGGAKRVDSISPQKKGVHCPSEEVLACYLDNLLSDDEVENMEEHLIRCSDCTRQAVFLHKLKKSVRVEGYIETPQQAINRAKDIVIEKAPKDFIEVILGFARDTITVIKDTGAMFTPSDLVPAEARKGHMDKTKDFINLTKVFDNVKAGIVIERVNDRSCELEVVTTDASAETPLNDIRLTLLSGERELASYLTVNGRASFKNICLGDYTLVISRKRETIGNIRLHMEVA